MQKVPFDSDYGKSWDIHIQHRAPQFYQVYHASNIGQGWGGVWMWISHCAGCNLAFSSCQSICNDQSWKQVLLAVVFFWLNCCLLLLWEQWPTDILFLFDFELCSVAEDGKPSKNMLRLWLSAFKPLVFPTVYSSFLEFWQCMFLSCSREELPTCTARATSEICTKVTSTSTTAWWLR